MKTDLQFVNCNLCGDNNTKLLTIQNGFNIVRCKNCKLVYVNPRPSAESLPELYSTYHSRKSEDPESWLHLMKENFRHSAEILQETFFETSILHGNIKENENIVALPYIPSHQGRGDKKGFLLSLRERFPHLFPLPLRERVRVRGVSSGEKRRLLDVGCAYGYFLDIMKGNGWDVTGIEPSLNTLKIARDRGLNVIEGTIENINFHENSFDSVTMFYVLEHLFDPLAALKKIFSMLKPNGVLILRVPHTTPIVRLLSLLRIKNNLYDPPFHLYDFSPVTVTMLLKKAGFSSIHIMPGRPTYPKNYIERIIALLSTNLARVVFALSLGKVLLPGVSKTVTAIK